MAIILVGLSYQFCWGSANGKEMHCSQLFNASTAVGAMYARAFSGEANKASTRTDSYPAGSSQKDMNKASCI